MPRRKIEIDCGTRVSFAALFFSVGQANGDQMVKEKEERKKERKKGDGGGTKGHSIRTRMMELPIQECRRAEEI